MILLTYSMEFVGKLKLLYVVAQWNMGNIFPSFSYFARHFTRKYETREKYWPINYLIVKCLLKSNMAGAFLVTHCIDFAKNNVILT